MSLQYRFIGRDSRSQAVIVASAAFSLWLADRKRLSVDVNVNGRREEAPGKEVAVLRGEGDGVTAVRYAYYEESGQGRWATILTAIEGPDESWLWVDLEWVSEDPWGWRPTVKPPALIQYLLQDDTVSLYKVPLRAAASHVVDVEGALALADLIRDPDRGAPVVVLSFDDRVAAPELGRRATTFVRELAGVAPVFVLSAESQPVFNGALPPAFAVYGGAVRTYMPDLEAGVPMRRHRILGAAKLLQADRAAITVALPLRARALTTRPPALYRDRAAALLRPAAAGDDDLLQLAENLAAEQAEAAAAASTKKLQEELEWQAELNQEAEKELDRAQARIRYLSSELATHKVAAEGLLTPEEFEVEDINSFDELLDFAPTLTNLTFGDTSGPATALDEYTSAGTWARRSWRALRALNDYVDARRDGFAGDFRAWCADPGVGATGIPTGWLALRESDTTSNNARFKSARTFPVPVAVDQSGRVYMEAHIKVVEGGRPAPRIHFHDASNNAEDPRVYIGYIGAHLPNEKTN